MVKTRPTSGWQPGSIVLQTNAPCHHGGASDRKRRWPRPLLSRLASLPADRQFPCAASPILFATTQSSCVHDTLISGQPCPPASLIPPLLSSSYRFALPSNPPILHPSFCRLRRTGIEIRHRLPTWPTPTSPSLPLARMLLRSRGDADV